MGYTQRVQFTANPTWIARGSLPDDVGDGFGAERMRIEGTQTIGGSPRTIKVDVGAETSDGFFPGLSPELQYRVTIEEVTA